MNPNSKKNKKKSHQNIRIMLLKNKFIKDKGKFLEMKSWNVEQVRLFLNSIGIMNPIRFVQERIDGYYLITLLSCQNCKILLEVNKIIKI